MFGLMASSACKSLRKIVRSFQRLKSANLNFSRIYDRIQIFLPELQSTHPMHGCVFRNADRLSHLQKSDCCSTAAGFDSSETCGGGNFPSTFADPTATCRDKTVRSATDQKEIPTALGHDLYRWSHIGFPRRDWLRLLFRCVFGL